MSRGFIPRIFWYLAFSVALHFAAIFGLAAGFSGATVFDQGRQATSLSLTLVKNTMVVPGALSGYEAQERLTGQPSLKQAGRPPLKDGLLFHSVELEPQLISEMDWNVDDVRVTGRLFLTLVVEVDGSVTEPKVTYSELPQRVTTDLLGRLAGARFQPAMRDGQSYRKTILLMLEVE